MAEESSPTTTPSPNDRFLAEIREFVKNIPRAEKSEPGAWYSEAGDCIFVHWEDVPYYAEWINHDLTLYRTMDDKRIVGCAITGIVGLMKKSGVIATLQRIAEAEESSPPSV